MDIRFEDVFKINVPNWITNTLAADLIEVKVKIQKNFHRLSW